MFFCSASSRILNAFSVIESSCIDDPIFPPKALINVNDIPPPIIMSSTLSIMFSIIGIFDEIFEPPKTARIGEAPLLITLFKARTSFSSSFPKNLFSKYFATTVVEACALCAVPKASFT